MKRKVVPVVLLLVAAGAAAWYYFMRPRETEELTLSGSIEARTVEVGSLVGGRVARVFVEEGAMVKAGQPLVAFEPDLRDLEIAEQRARIAEAGAVLARTQAGPRDEETRRARIDWESAETDRKRFQTLFESGVIPRREYETAQVRAAKALETLREAQRGGRREDVEAARAALAREEQRLSFLERQREEMLVTAPTTGVVEVLDLRPGDLVAANQPVATILEPGQLWVRVYVPETELGRVRLGQKARVFVDTYPDRPFRGWVVEIRDQGEYTPRNLQTLEQRSDQVFGVKVRIEPSPELKAGMAALVDLGLAAEPSPGVRG